MHSLSMHSCIRVVMQLQCLHSLSLLIITVRLVACYSSDPQRTCHRSDSSVLGTCSTSRQHGGLSAALSTHEAAVHCRL